MSARIHEKPDKKYGYWRIIGFDKLDKNNNAMYTCECTLCGRQYSVRGFAMRTGRSTHCRHCNGKG